MKRVLVIAALALLVAIMPLAAVSFAQGAGGPLPNGASQINAGVVPPQFTYLGMTYWEWGAAWWQWASGTGCLMCGAQQAAAASTHAPIRPRMSVFTCVILGASTMHTFLYARRL